MGLAGAKNKRRLGNDPNNTKWSRNTETFGQKLLRSQGWEPGQYLGSRDASHAEYHSEASTSHIRVTIKDDMLGLGAKRNNGDECTGLDAFQHLLGRLNGKSEDVLAAEEKKREDTRLSLYVERKLGRINFIRGGWLVGDTLKEEPSDGAPEVKSETEEEESTDVAEPMEVDGPTTEEKKPSKKRKVEQEADKDEEKAAHKKEKKSKRRKTDSGTETDSEDTKEKKKNKKSKKRKTAESDEGDTEPTESSKSSKKSEKEKERQSSTEESSDALNEEDAEKAAKKEKRKEKKGKKEKKEKRKKDKSASDPSVDDKKEKRRRKKEKEGSESLASGVSTPIESGSGYSTPTVTSNTRYLARSRFIAQKKMAFADTAALNQIFMIKS